MAGRGLEEEGKRVSHLHCHAHRNKHEHALGVVHLAQALEQSRLSGRPLLVEARLHLTRGPGEAALGLGDMEELAVAGLEEGDSKGIPDAHNPELSHLGSEWTDGVADLDGEPVEVKENDAGKS